MNAQNKEELQKLFNSAYFISKENSAFAKFPQLCKLQMKNGDLLFLQGVKTNKPERTKI